MRYTPLGGVMFACLLAGHHPALAQIPTVIDELRVLAAIAQAETGTINLARACTKVGAAGERSAWQFKRTTWRLYTTVPFERASADPFLAHLVARLHLRYLRMCLESVNITPNVFNLAQAWNAGPGPVIKTRAPSSTYDYAKRVNALYDDLPKIRWELGQQLRPLAGEEAFVLRRAQLRAN